MSAGRSLRGQPLAALIAVLVGWTGGRATSWEPPEFADGPFMSEAFAARAPDARAARPQLAFARDLRVGPQSSAGPSAFSSPETYPGAWASPPPGFPRGAMPVFPVAPYPVAVRDGPRISPEGLGLAPLPPGDWLATGQFTGEAAPRFFAPELAGAGGGGPPVPFPPARARRWSADGWALLREGQGGGLSPGALPATYGASQAGAVLRYRLDLSSPLRPAAYMRTTSSLGQYRETAAALGLSARPFAGIPLVAAVEGRLTEQLGQSRVQPAAFLYSEMPPLPLPLRARAEAYFQGGYVGGRFATPFADGQVRIDRGLWRSGPVDARLGGGLWGGAQRGAARLDAGPSAIVALPLGRGRFGRIAVDWRFRVMGDADPGSGPAVTLSAGF